MNVIESSDPLVPAAALQFLFYKYSLPLGAGLGYLYGKTCQYLYKQNEAHRFNPNPQEVSAQMRPGLTALIFSISPLIRSLFNLTTHNTTKSKSPSFSARIMVLSETCVNLDFFAMLKKLGQLPRPFDIAFVAASTTSLFAHIWKIEISKKFPAFLTTQDLKKQQIGFMF